MHREARGKPRTLPREDGGGAPQLTECIAGRLAYTDYGWVTSRLVRAIARDLKAPADVTGDHEFTDWQQVHELADRLVAMVNGHAHEVA